MKRGDIYLVFFDPGQGRDQRGSRPVLIVSPDRFNQATKLPDHLPDCGRRRICPSYRFLRAHFRHRNHRRHPLRPAARP